MLKIQILPIIILIGCIVFVSCEYAPQVLKPTQMDMGTMDPPAMMDPDTMKDMTDPMIEGSPVVINELMADNDEIIADPQGDYDDWLELHNLTDNAVLLTGMYLSDKEDEPTKWQFPENTEIPANGYLIVWLDENGEDAPDGLHANFKLSKNGETAMLVDTDARGNTVLDSVTFGEQETDVAFGRLPNGTGDFQVVQATPGAENRVE
jgi:hypothetical protein